MKRDHTIDAFRGIAIIGMIFFSLTLKLSTNLPELLKHNVRGSVHLGDFILPMFLFASGLSLAYFLHKREKVKQNIFLYDVSKRFVQLALVGISLSFFSAYGFLEMDEVMLSALLFIGCIALHKFNWKVIICIIFLINLSYIALILLDQTNIFYSHYLGGYPAALYYFPLMLVGLLIGKGIISSGVWCKRNKITIALIFVFFLIFWIFIPINKLTASASFIMLSILISFIIFVLIDMMVENILSLEKLEKIGRKPLRYWLMMYIIFIIPLRFYIELSTQILPLNITWYLGIFCTIVFIILLLILSNIIDLIKIRYKQHNSN